MLATAKLTGLGTMTFKTVLFNAKGQQIELVESGGRPAGVVHTYVHGAMLDGPVPTCFTGGDPPSGCPFDQITLLSNHLSSVPISVGHGAKRRNYGTTPRACPRSHQWSSRITLYYADGSRDTVVSRQSCTATRARHGKR